MAKAVASKKPAAAAVKPAKKPAKAPAAAKPAKAPAAAKPAAKAPKAPKAPKAAPAVAEAPAAAAAAAGDADVLIVSNKVCNAFKTRAEGLRKAVLAAKPAAKVVIDEQKALGRNPDKGTFSVAVRGVTVKACVAMARPFPAMKALDMAALAAEVIAKL
jgi:hypothetical protein